MSVTTTHLPGISEVHPQGHLPALSSAESGAGCSALPPIPKDRGNAVQCPQSSSPFSGKASAGSVAAAATTGKPLESATSSKLSEAAAGAIRTEIDKMARELTVLEDLEQREIESQRMREKKAALEFDRLAKEQAEMERQKDAEMRKYIDEMRAERVAKETEESLKKEALDQANAVPSAVENEETRAFRTSMKSQITELYNELDELMDENYIQKQKSREKEAWMRRRRDDAEEKAAQQALAVAEAPEARVVKYRLRKELDSLRQEAKDLERATFLASQRTQAREQDLRMKREGESQRQIEYMTVVRERALARENADVEEAKQELIQTVAGFPVTLISKVDPNFRPGEPPEHTVERLLAADPYTMTPSLPSDKKPTPVRKPVLRGKELVNLTDFEKSQLEIEDIRLQKERQRRDLEELYKEHSWLIGDQEAAEQRKVHSELSTELNLEADTLKRKLLEKHLPPQTLAQMYPPNIVNLPVYLPPSTVALAARPADTLSHEQLRDLQQQQAEDLTMIDRHYAAERKRMAEAVKTEQEQKVKDRQRHLLRVGLTTKKVDTTERQSFNDWVQEQKEALKALRDRLQTLEQEDSGVPTEAERRLANQVEVAQQLEEQLRLERDRASQEQLRLQSGQKQALERVRQLQQQLLEFRFAALDHQVEEFQKARQREADRWEPSLAAHPDLLTPQVADGAGTTADGLPLEPDFGPEYRLQLMLEKREQLQEALKYAQAALTELRLKAHQQRQEDQETHSTQAEASSGKQVSRLQVEVDSLQALLSSYTNIITMMEQQPQADEG